MARLALLAATLGAVVAVVAPTAANAAVPCRDRIYNDWYKDGKIASTYPISCYRDALKHVPVDALTYSSLADDIRSAMQGALAREHGKKDVPAQIGTGGQGSMTAATQVKPLKKPKSSTEPSQSSNPKTGGSSSPSSTVASSSTSGSGGGVPTPIIVLGALAFVLVGAGGIGAGVRHYRRRDV
jgi:hypothetical protein